MLEKRYPKGKIAEIFGVPRSTIYRELNETVSNTGEWYGYLLE